MEFSRSVASDGVSLESSRYFSRGAGRVGQAGSRR
jgi:hypothetical protein